MPGVRWMGVLVEPFTAILPRIGASPLPWHGEVVEPGRLTSAGGLVHHQDGGAEDMSAALAPHVERECMPGLVGQRTPEDLRQGASSFSLGRANVREGDTDLIHGAHAVMVDVEKISRQTGTSCSNELLQAMIADLAPDE